VIKKYRFGIFVFMYFLLFGFEAWDGQDQRISFYMSGYDSSRIDIDYKVYYSKDLRYFVRNIKY